MRDFSKVSPKLWRSPRFRSVGDDAQKFYIYLLTCEHQTSAGCFRLPDAYAADDLTWHVERLEPARSELQKAGLAIHDGASDEYYVPRWFRHNPADSPGHIKGVRRLISELDSEIVREVAETEFEEQQASKKPLDAPSQHPQNNNSRLAHSGYLNGKRS